MIMMCTYFDIMVDTADTVVEQSVHCPVWIGPMIISYCTTHCTVLYLQNIMKDTTVF